jgi:tetratricopeptide (TPR) repeat protein
MMLIHDMEISKSLFDPWTTFAAAVVLLLILVVALLISRKRPLISYCIIFFFLNHLIEGSFISLGLVYEHRNYLPSMLFFVPLSIFIIYTLSYYQTRKMMMVIISSAIAAIIIIMGVSVYIQNDILKDEISLWSDNIQKAPRLHHVRQNLGAAYFIEGRLPEAFVELTKALKSLSAANVKAKAKTYGLLGEYYILRGDDEKAMMHYMQALKIDPYFSPVYNRIAEIKVRKNQLADAEEIIRIGIVMAPHSYAFRLTLARIMLKQGHPDAAIKEAQKALMLGGDPSKPYGVFAEAFKMKRDHRMADHFYKLANKMQLPNPACESGNQLVTLHKGT